MKNLLICLQLVVALFVGSCKQESSLFGSFDPKEERDVRLSDLLGGECVVVPLTTPAHVVMGRIDKIVKKHDSYFVLADQSRIFQFDNQGNYISDLFFKGNGPDEYKEIADFDVAYQDGDFTILVTDYHSIKTYQYNGAWMPVKNVRLDYVLHKIKLLGDDFLLQMTGQADESIALSTLDGQILKTALPWQPALLTLNPIQFVRVDSVLVFQLAMTNSYVSFSPHDQRFSEGILFNSNSLFSKSELLDLFAQNGIDYLGQLSDKMYINAVRTLNGRTFVNLSDKGVSKMVVQSADGQIRSVALDGGIADDLTGLNTSKFLQTMYLSESDNSLLFCLDPQSDDDFYRLLEVRN